MPAMSAVVATAAIVTMSAMIITTAMTVRVAPVAVVRPIVARVAIIDRRRRYCHRRPVNRPSITINRRCRVHRSGNTNAYAG
jgi:hypothetical protein